MKLLIMKTSPYRTASKIIILYVLIFKFLEERLMTKDPEQNGSKHSPNLICS